MTHATFMGERTDEPSVVFPESGVLIYSKRDLKNANMAAGISPVNEKDPVVRVWS